MLGLLALPLLHPAAVAAQLPVPDASALAHGELVSATARGYAAVAANPAGLGLSRRIFTATLLPVRGRAGLDPIRLGALAEWDGRDIPRRVREAWLDRVRNVGRQQGSVHAGATAFALSDGRLGFQLATSAGGAVRLNPDAAELLLFGNAGLTGEPRPFDLEGSRADAWVVTTAAVAWGAPLGEVHGGRLALGATLKLTVGNALWVARDLGSTVGEDPLEVRLAFPVLSRPGGGLGLRDGGGLGLDLGVAWEGDRLLLGGQVRNAFNTFRWDLDDLVFRAGAALLGPDDSTTDFEERPAAEAPRELWIAARDLGFRPELSLGAGYRAGRTLLVSGGLHLRRRGGMEQGAAQRLGVAAAIRTAPWLSLRLSAGAVDGGRQIGGGASLHTGRLRVDVGVVEVRGGAHDGLGLGLSVGWPES